MFRTLGLLLGLTFVSSVAYAAGEELSALVLVAHQRCEKDSDCIRLVMKCSCDCGVPLNVNFTDFYLRAKEERCKDYSGPMCKFACPEKTACVQKKCVMVEQGSNPVG